MQGQQRKWWVLGLGGAVVAAFASGCGDDFGSCRDSRTCEAEPGGEGGGAGETDHSATAGLGGASGTEPGAGGDTGEAGAVIQGGTSSGGAGGIGENQGACADGYTDWFSSSFSFPNGAIIGTADFPSMPWVVKTGSLTIETGRLTGAGAAVASQGVAFPYAGSRVRFRARFTGSDQQITAVFNAAGDGSAGLRLTLDSAGSLSLIEGKVVVGTTDFASLETGVDWFVEALFGATGAEVSLARANYGTEKQAKIESTLSTNGLKSTANGAIAVAELASASGIAPSLDELSISRCGVPVPEYQPLLVDTFERPDSTTVGKAEFPTTSTWKTSAASVRIVGGALESKGGGNATIPLKVPTSGLRIRTTIRMVNGANPYLWADVNYNGQAGIHGSSLPGFWMWGGPTGYFNTGIFAEVDHDPKHNVAIAPDVPYFVQLDRDGDFAVLTVRTQSFTGPILAVNANSGLTGKPDSGSFFTVGDEGGDGTRFDDIRLDSYTGQ